MNAGPRFSSVHCTRTVTCLLVCFVLSCTLAVLGVDVLVAPPVGFPFPATVAALNQLTSVQLLQLENFYNIGPVAGLTVPHRRNRLKQYIQ